MGGDDNVNEVSEPEALASPTGGSPDAAHRGAATDRTGGQETTADFAEEDMELEDAALGALVREKLSKRHRAGPY